MKNNLPHHTLQGPASGTPLILGPSLGTSLHVWDPQLPALTRTHRTLRWDLPGHGGSPASLLDPTHPPRVADLATLVLRLADAQGWERFSYAGISLGGAVGLRLAADHPDRIDRLAVVCSAARFGTPESWRERADLVRAKGTATMADSRPGTWFSPAFAKTQAGQRLIEDLIATDRTAYAAACEALAAFDIRAELPTIKAPTLVIAGRNDPATPPASARELADSIPHATLLEIPEAAHLANAERPEPVTAALLQHFTRTPTGETVRRAVLGDAHVDRATTTTTPFTAPFQDFITRYAWGEIWTDPTLDHRTRSCITLTALTAHGHHTELALHVRAALTNGLSRTEIGAVLLQTAVYCGVPAANSAFAVAQRVFDELDGTNNG